MLSDITQSRVFYQNTKHSKMLDVLLFCTNKQERKNRNEYSNAEHVFLANTVSVRTARKLKFIFNLARLTFRSKAIVPSCIFICG